MGRRALGLSARSSSVARNVAGVIVKEAQLDRLGGWNRWINHHGWYA